MKKPPKSTLFLLGALVVGGALGTGITYALVHDTDKNKVSVINAQPEKPEFANVSSISAANTKLPDGVLSPTDIASQAFKYTGKEVKVHGQIVQTQPNQYNIIGTDEQQPVGLKVDFGSSGLNAKDYVIDPANSKTVSKEKPADPTAYTVTGKLVENKGQNNTSTFQLQIIKIEK